MLSPEEYRKREQACRDKAQTAANESERTKWLELAETWQQMAETGVVIPRPIVAESTSLGPPKENEALMPETGTR